MESLLEDRYVSQHLLVLLPPRSCAVLSQVNTTAMKLFSHIDWYVIYSKLTGVNVLDYKGIDCLWQGDKTDQETWRQLSVRVAVNGPNTSMYFRHPLEYITMCASKDVIRTGEALSRAIYVGLSHTIVQHIIGIGHIEPRRVAGMLIVGSRISSKEVLRVLYKECIKRVNVTGVRSMVLDAIKTMRSRFTAEETVYITGTRCSLR